MIVDMHTYADKPRRTGGLETAMLATLRPAGVAAAVVSAISDNSVIRHFFRMTDALDIYYVGIGSDLPASVASTEMPDFSQYSEIVAAVQGHGLNHDEGEKVCPGNWLPVLRAVSA